MTRLGEEQKRKSNDWVRGGVEEMGNSWVSKKEQKRMINDRVRGGAKEEEQ